MPPDESLGGLPRGLLYSCCYGLDHIGESEWRSVFPGLQPSLRLWECREGLERQREAFYALYLYLYLLLSTIRISIAFPIPILLFVFYVVSVDVV